MRARKIGVIVRREYGSRIKTKGFWISTLALPLLMIGLWTLPLLLAATTETSQRLVIVDATGEVAQRLVRRLRGEAGELAQVARFEITLAEPQPDNEAQRQELDRQVLAEEVDAWVWISSDGLDADQVEYHAQSVSNFLTQEILEQALSAEVRRWRLERAGYDVDVIGELTRSVNLETIRVSEEGSRAEAGMAGFWMAYVLFFLLYSVLLVYGQQVMQGVLEEKGSRVVELLVASVRPFDLMMGKLLGIGFVGLTQLGIWLGSVALFTLPAAVASMQWMPEGLDLPSLSFAVVGHYLLLFLLGFFVYATFYAAIGSAFNNLQEAQQMAGLAVVFLIAPVVFMLVIINDPDSPLAVVTSLIPILTPLLMALRIAVKMPPLWQILLAYLLTSTFIVFMVWVCARIYRVGILMYGKKPTLREMWRWVRYA